MFGLNRNTATTADTSGALAAGRDTSGRRIPSEGAPTYEDRSGVNAERGRGFLSGDGEMHPHRS